MMIPNYLPTIAKSYYGVANPGYVGYPNPTTYSLYGDVDASKYWVDHIFRRYMQTTIHAGNYTCDRHSSHLSGRTTSRCQ